MDRRRHDLACGFIDAGYEYLFGDLGFGLGIPIPVRSLRTLHLLGMRAPMPIMGRLPFEWLYPTGEKQETSTPKFRSWLIGPP